MSQPAPQPPAGFADDHPSSSARGELSTDARARIQSILQQHAARPGALLPVLHEVQEALGCIPPEAVPELARGLGLSRAEVHGVITFYPHFRSTPAGRVHVEICRAESCQAMGATALVQHARERLGCDLQQSTADGRYTLDPVFCLGLCAQSPAMMVNGQPHARLTAERFNAIIAAQEADA